MKIKEKGSKSSLKGIFTGMFLMFCLIVCLASYAPISLYTLSFNGTGTNTTLINPSFQGIITANLTGSVLDTYTQSTNGFTSFSNNKSALVNISVGSSPFSYQNSSTNNINVFINGGIITAITINGTSVGSTVNPIPLQIGETAVITYTGSPTMVFKPF